MKNATPRPSRARAAGATRAAKAPKRRDQEVLDAAARVFHHRGYADSSVQDIADELGILKGSLYHYIESKEDLLYRILQQTHEEVQAILDEVAALPDLPPLDRLREYTRRQVEYSTKNLAKIAIYYHDVDQLSEQRRKSVYAQRRVHEAFVADLITEAQQRGEADPDTDPRTVANCLFGSMIWVYRWYRPRGRISAATIADTCAKFVLEGVVGGMPRAR